MGRSTCHRNAARWVRQRLTAIRADLTIRSYFDELSRSSGRRYIMIDLKFANHSDADAFLRKMERIWRGSTKPVMPNPRTRVPISCRSPEASIHDASGTNNAFARGLHDRHIPDVEEPLPARPRRHKQQR